MTKNNGLTDEEVNEMIRYVREGDWDRYLVASNALRAELDRLRKENEALSRLVLFHTGAKGYTTLDNQEIDRIVDLARRTSHD